MTFPFDFWSPGYCGKFKVLLNSATELRTYHVPFQDQGIDKISHIYLHLITLLLITLVH